MRTRSPISTISYNSPEYLKEVLNQLQKAKIIEFWAFISHLPEPDNKDEAGEKEHIHLYIVPAKQLQTADLKEQFNEFDPTKPDKPKKVLAFRTSKTFKDWYLYGIHDRQYLAYNNNQTRKYHYRYDDVETSDEDELRLKVREIDLSDLSPIKNMHDAILLGVTFKQYVASGRVPIQQIGQYEKTWMLLTSNEINRNGRSGEHEIEGKLEEKKTIVADAETGEVLSVNNDSEDDFLDEEELPF